MNCDVFKLKKNLWSPKFKQKYFSVVRVRKMGGYCRHAHESKIEIRWDIKIQKERGGSKPKSKVNNVITSPPRSAVYATRKHVYRSSSISWLNTYIAEIDFRRQNLTSVDVRF